MSITATIHLQHLFLYHGRTGTVTEEHSAQSHKFVYKKSTTGNISTKKSTVCVQYNSHYRQKQLDITWHNGPERNGMIVADSCPVIWLSDDSYLKFHNFVTIASYILRMRNIESLINCDLHSTLTVVHWKCNFWKQHRRTYAWNCPTTLCSLCILSESYCR